MHCPELILVDFDSLISTIFNTLKHSTCEQSNCRKIASKLALIRVAYQCGLTQLTLTAVIAVIVRIKESGDVAEYAWYCIPQ